MSMLQTLFGGPKTPAGGQQQPNPQAAQQQQQPNQHVQGNNTIPKGNEPQANPNPATEQTQSPTDNFKDIWSNVNQPANAAPNFKLNPEKSANASD